MEKTSFTFILVNVYGQERSIYILTTGCPHSRAPMCSWKVYLIEWWNLPLAKGEFA